MSIIPGILLQQLWNHQRLNPFYPELLHIIAAIRLNTAHLLFNSVPPTRRPESDLAAT